VGLSNLEDPMSTHLLQGVPDLDVASAPSWSPKTVVEALGSRHESVTDQDYPVYSSSPAPDPQSQSVSLTRIRQFSRW
jgi:hypothetical protein